MWRELKSGHVHSAFSTAFPACLANIGHVPAPKIVKKYPSKQLKLFA